MFRVYTCLTVDHDWRLVVLAIAVCVLASAVAVSLFHRAQAATGRARVVWLGLDAATAGCGIWATHFIAMLAYDPGIGAGYNLVLTILSLLIAVLITGAGLGISLFNFRRWGAVLGGAIVGGGIAAMHYTGMMALELPGYITWAPNLVVASVALGIAFGGLALNFAARRDDWANTLIAIVLLTLAITCHALHWNGRRIGHARSDAPGRRRRDCRLPLSHLSSPVSRRSFSEYVSSLALSDRQSKRTLQQQKILLDTALENMSQGLCMCDADGRITLFNERFANMMALPGCLAQGITLTRPN